MRGKLWAARQHVPELSERVNRNLTDSCPLRPAQRKALLDHYRRHPDPAVRLRAHIILMLAAGLRWSLIRAALFCSSRTVARWKRRFEEGGVEALLGRPRGLPCRWSEEATAILRDALEHTPDQLNSPDTAPWGHSPDIPVWREGDPPNERGRLVQPSTVLSDSQKKPS
jgi:hypothetical protein